MFNVAVFKIKDLLKYLVSVAIVIVLLSLLTRFFNSDNENFKVAINSKVEEFTNIIILKALNTSIPCIENLNDETDLEAEETDNENKDILQKILDIELGYINNLDVKSEIKAETESQEENDIQLLDNVAQSTEIVTQNPIANAYNINYNGVLIKNETSYELTDDMLLPNIDLNKENIVIFHTHTCESYTSSEEYQYAPTGNYRTTDLNYSVARVGDELCNYLTGYGYNVVHDKTYHDYPAYTGSYSRSLQTVTNILNQNNADIVIDLHRDAIGSNPNYAPTVKVADDYAAQVMFVMGTNGGGLYHPNWNQNLKFAVKVQEKANELYPGLFKPIILRNSRYNQHLAKAACIIEVGATGNTLEQCLTSMKYLSKVIDETISNN